MPSYVDHRCGPEPQWWAGTRMDGSGLAAMSLTLIQHGYCSIIAPGLRKDQRGELSGIFNVLDGVTNSWRYR